MQKIKKKTLFISLILIILIAGVIVRYGYINYTNNKNYSFNITSADKDFKEDKFSEAKTYYNTALKYKDDGSIKAKLILCDVVANSLDTFNKATVLYNDKNYIDAYNAFRSVSPQDEKRYTLSQNKAKDSLKLYTDVKVASAKVFAGKSDFSNAIGQLNEIPTTNGGNTIVKNLIAQYQDAQQKKLVAGAAVTTEPSGEQYVFNNTKSTTQVTNNSADTSVPNSATKVEPKTSTPVAKTPINNTTNNLIKQRYESELANLFQQIQTAKSEKNVSIYENGKWNWEADQIAVNSAQKAYDAKNYNYKIWLSTIQ